MKIRNAIVVILNKNLAIKNFVKFFYYNIFYLFGFMRFSFKKKLRTYFGFEASVIGDGTTFFGYYDFSPLASGNVLYHQLDGDSSDKPSDFNKVAIYMAALDGGNKTFLCDSGCFNWQQGARVNWLDDKVICNASTDAGKPITLLLNVHNRTEQIFVRGFHYQAHDSNDIYFLNYYAIARLRPDYGYFNEVDEASASQIQNAIYVLSRNGEGDPAPIVTEEFLRTEFSIPTEVGVELNHLMPAPDCCGFVFILRRHWRNRRDGALIFFDKASGAVRKLTDFGIVSHVAWRNSSSLFGYFQSPEYGLTYQSLNVRTGDVEDFSWLTSITKGDGHPSFVTEDICFTDTYPDKYGVQRLFKVDLNLKRADLILENFHARHFRGEVRCDFHPRGVSEDMVFIDAIADGVRKLVCLQVKSKC